MKFAAHILLFSCDQYILRMIANCGPFVDRIYVAYSEYPWNKYNVDARDQFKNLSDINILNKSKYYEKICLIEGVWDSEEAQRNACLKKAKEDDFDFLIIQDADEFYLNDDYINLIQDINNNTDYDIYRTKWLTFWKTTDFALVDKNGNIFIGRPEFAVNCRKNVFFKNRRSLDTDNSLFLNHTCFHFSYVLNDEQLWCKINTWSHSREFDSEYWFKHKWQKWNPLFTRNIHPTDPDNWYKAIKYSGPLPNDIISLTSSNDIRIYFSFSSLISELRWSLVFYLNNRVKPLVAKIPFVLRLYLFMKDRLLKRTPVL